MVEPLKTDHADYSIDIRYLQELIVAVDSSSNFCLQTLNPEPKGAYFYFDKTDIYKIKKKNYYMYKIIRHKDNEDSIVHGSL